MIDILLLVSDNLLTLNTIICQTQEALSVMVKVGHGQGCYGASLLPDTFKNILLTLADDRCAPALQPLSAYGCVLVLSKGNWSLKFCLIWCSELQ